SSPVIAIVAVAVANVKDEAVCWRYCARWTSQSNQDEPSLVVLKDIPRSVPCHCLSADDRPKLGAALKPQTLRVTVIEAGSRPSRLRDTFRCSPEPLCSHSKVPNARIKPRREAASA